MRGPVSGDPLWLVGSGSCRLAAGREEGLEPGVCKEPSGALEPLALGRRSSLDVQGSRWAVRLLPLLHHSQSLAFPPASPPNSLTSRLWGAQWVVAQWTTEVTETPGSSSDLCTNYPSASLPPRGRSVQTLRIWVSHFLANSSLSRNTNRGMKTPERR